MRTSTRVIVSLKLTFWLLLIHVGSKFEAVGKRKARDYSPRFARRKMGLACRPLSMLIPSGHPFVVKHKKAFRKPYKRTQGLSGEFSFIITVNSLFTVFIIGNLIYG